MMSLTLMATKSMPIVSWIPISNASFSFDPTPSVPATRYESPKGYRPPNPPIPGAMAAILLTSSVPASISTPASLYVRPVLLLDCPSAITRTLFPLRARTSDRIPAFLSTGKPNFRSQALFSGVGKDLDEEESCNSLLRLEEETLTAAIMLGTCNKHERTSPLATAAQSSKQAKLSPTIQHLSKKKHYPNTNPSWICKSNDNPMSIELLYRHPTGSIATSFWNPRQARTNFRKRDRDRDREKIVKLQN